MPKKFLLIFILALTLSFCNTAWNERQAEREAREERIRELYETYDDLFKAFLTNTNIELGKEVVKYEEISPGLFPKKVTFKGSYRDLGKWVGLMALKQGIYPSRRTDDNREINQKIEKMYKNIFPPFLERARGIAWAYSLNMEDLDLRHLEYGFSSTLWWQLFRYKEFLELTKFSTQSSSDMCSVVSYYLEDEKRHLVGRNYDLPTDRPHFMVVSNLKDVYRTVGTTCYQLHNFFSDGINEKGLFMAITANIHPPPYDTYGYENYPELPAVQNSHLQRLVLDSCATVDEALDLVKKIRVWFPNALHHFLIADALGNSVVIEHDQNKNLHIFPRTEFYLVLTNSPFVEGLDFVFDNCSRFRRATNLCEQGISNMDEFWEVVCSIQMTYGSTRSLWTSRADLKKLEYDVRFWSEEWEIPHVLRID